MDSKLDRPAGTFYGVGVGPGDPELITLKAQRVLARVPVVCVPKGRLQGESYARSIVGPLVDERWQELVELFLPMTRDRAQLALHHMAAVEQIAGRLKEGKDVAFVTEGDPSIYSTFIYLCRLLRETHPELPVEVVPGVSSINASAAAAGIPLVDGGERLAVLPTSYEGDGLAGVLEQFDTVVLLKVSRVFDRVLDALERLDLAGRAVYIQRCGAPTEKIVRDVRTLRGQELDYLSLVIVRKG